LLEAASNNYSSLAAPIVDSELVESQCGSDALDKGSIKCPMDKSLSVVREMSRGWVAGGVGRRETLRPIPPDLHCL
jgi:hypothetical protein